jgi:hypothetical protein
MKLIKINNIPNNIGAYVVGQNTNMIDLKEIETLKQLKNSYADEIYNLQQSTSPEAKNTIQLIMEQIFEIDEQIKILSKPAIKKDNKNLGLIYIVGIGILVFVLIKQGRKKQ